MKEEFEMETTKEAIVIGALMLSWAAESAELIISEGLALAIVAWLQVLPEFTVVQQERDVLCA